MTGTFIAQLTSRVPVPPAGIGFSSATRTRVVVFHPAERLSAFSSLPLARMRVTVIPLVLASTDRERATRDVKRFWSSRIDRLFRTSPLGLVMVTVSRPETIPVAGSSRVSIE